MSAVRFLVADSSPALQTFVKNLLVNYGFEAAWVHTSRNPQSALAAAKEQAPHFLLTDCFAKSALNAVALVQELKALNPDLRWALMSTQLHPELNDTARHQGAMFQLEKPFGVHDMQSAMGKALEQWGRDNHEVGRRMPGYRRPRMAPTAPLVPDTPTLKAGDLVDYQGTRDRVRYVIFRRGELLVQLDSTPGMLPATKLRKL